MLFVLTVTKRRGRLRSHKPGLQRWVERVFKPYIQESFLASAWPGTMVCDGYALVYVVEFNEAVKGLVMNGAPNLKDWDERNTPPLPEDICLLKTGDPFPTLMSVIHEGDAWLLTNENPRLRGVSFSKTIRRANRKREFIFEDKYFCRVWRER